MTALSPGQTAEADQDHAALMDSLTEHVDALRYAAGEPLICDTHPARYINTLAVALRQKHSPNGISRLCAAALIELARLTPGATP